MNEIPTIKGKVEATKQRDAGFSVKIGENWLSAFGTCPYNNGDELEIPYVENKGFKNFQTNEVKVLNKAPEPVKAINPAELNADKRRILDCVLAVFKKGETKTQEELTEVANNLHEAMETIYLNFAAKAASSIQIPKPIILSADEIPDKEEMIRKFDEMQIEGDKIRSKF